MSSSAESTSQVGGAKGLERTSSKAMHLVFVDKENTYTVGPLGGLGLQRTMSNVPQSGGVGLQRTMSKDLGGNAQQTLPGGGLQRTMSRDVGGAQQGGLQRTMSKDLGGSLQGGGLQRTMSKDLGGGSKLGGLQRTMSKDLGNAQPSSGGLQRTMSTGLGNLTASTDSTRLPKKIPVKGGRIPRSAGGQDPLQRQNAPIS